MRDLVQLPFEIRLNSPAFVGSVPKGKIKVHYFKGKDQDNRSIPRDKEVDRFPVDPCGLRVPTLRGILEFWHRSLLGDRDSDEIYQSQGSVFGATDVGQGITLVPFSTGNEQQGSELKFQGGMKYLQSFLYLGYGPLQLLKVRRNGEAPEGEALDDSDLETIVTSYNDMHARDAIRVDGPSPPVFKFIARGRKTQIEALKKALLLLHLFGGVGSRSRRGWGSVEVYGVKGIPAPPRSASEVPGWIQQALGSVWTERDYDVSKGVPVFSAFSPSTQIYVTGLKRGDYRTVLQEFYREFARVRSHRDKAPIAVKDHSREKADARSAAEHAITRVPLRLAFGMPYQPGRPNVWGISYQGRREDEEVTSRRASPLLLKVVRLGSDSNSYVGVALFLHASFFGDPTLKIGAAGKDLTLPFPGYEAIDEFLTGSGWTKVSLPS